MSLETVLVNKDLIMLTNLLTHGGNGLCLGELGSMRRGGCRQGCSKQGDGVTRNSRGHRATAIAIAARFCGGGVTRNGWWMSRYELRKLLAWETWTKAGVLPGLYLVPHCGKHRNSLDEIDPVHVLPLPTAKVRQMQLLLWYSSGRVIFRF